MLSERAAIEPVLEGRRVKRDGEGITVRGNIPRYACDNDLCAYSATEDVEYVRPVMRPQLGKGGGASYVEAIEP